ncbi:MAG: 3-dehydroquinate dehydratase [Bacteroidetes bacterium]|nr:3-dehydroquinate dehydratase [Bacteroidota bacterium]MCL5027177.1 3-dehydroquinate dehydratase [Chloroflexota bacterium]
MIILVVNGPNLNLLGTREPGIYGSTTLAQIEERLRERAKALDCEVEFFQSNHEGAIVDYLHSKMGEANGVVLNPGALAHYGLSLRDCLAALADVGVPAIEVHLSNIHAREGWRSNLVLAPVAKGMVAGVGWRGYLAALEVLVGLLREAQSTSL